VLHSSRRMECSAVTLQENNVIAQIDIKRGICVRIIPLGTKDYSLDIIVASNEISGTVTIFQVHTQNNRIHSF